MAKIPDDITRAIPRPARGVTTLRPNAMGGAQNLAEGLYDIGQADIRIQQQQRQVQAQFDTSRAETELTKSHLTTMNSLEGDDYAQYSPTYQKTMTEAKGNAAMLIRDPLARAKFEANADMTIARGEAQVMDRAKAKETDIGRASLITDVDQLSNLGLASSSEPDRVAALQSINSRINAAHAKGYLDAEAAASLRQKATVDYTVKSFELLPPAQRISTLTGKTNSALTSFLPPDVKATLLERAQSELITQQNAAEKAQKDAIDKGLIMAGNAIDTDPTRGLAAIDAGFLKQLTPDQKENLQRYADFKSKGREVTTDIAYMDRMQTLAARDPQRYVDQFDVTDVMAHAAPSDAEKLIGLKTGIIKGDAETKDHLQALYTIDQKIAQTIGGERGVDAIEDDAQKGKFRDGVQASVTQWQRENPTKKLSEMTDAESTKIIQQQLIKVKVPGFFNVFGHGTTNERYPFQLKEGQTPIDETAPEEPGWEDEARRLYGKNILKDVPPEHIAAIRRRIPDATDEEVLAFYREKHPQ